MKHFVLLLIVVCLWGSSSKPIEWGAPSPTSPSAMAGATPVELVSHQDLSGDPQILKPTRDESRLVSDASQAAAGIGVAEWLGPLAPIALSPYFGITCLAGMSQFGEVLPWAQNRFVKTNPVLREPAVFWIFLILTLATSLPRFSKVSKPIAQVLDRLEVYSTIITLIVMRAVVSGNSPVNETMVPIETGAGVISVSWELLMMVAAAINIFVISTVRFVCELLIWLSPFPSIDAFFELFNKTVCAGLMLLYSFSPLAATAFNLLIFAGCAVVFFPFYRRSIYMRSLIVDPVLTIIFPAMGRMQQGEIVVFNGMHLGSFPAKSKLYMSKTPGGWLLRQPRWLVGDKQVELNHDVGPLVFQKGIFLHRIRLSNFNDAPLIFSRRYNDTLSELIVALDMTEAANRAKQDATNLGGV